MLIGVEGPDRAGKTTLLKPLAAALGAKLVTRPPTPKELFESWHLVEPVYLHLLRQLHEPDRLYVTDRSMTCSGLVYSKVFGRPVGFDASEWIEHEFLVYVDTPIDVLKLRWTEEKGERVFPLEMYEAVVARYERVLKLYRHVRVDGTASVAANVNHAVAALREARAIRA